MYLNNLNPMYLLALSTMTQRKRSSSPNILLVKPKHRPRTPISKRLRVKHSTSVNLFNANHTVQVIIKTA